MNKQPTTSTMSSSSFCVPKKTSLFKLMSENVGRFIISNNGSSPHAYFLIPSLEQIPFYEKLLHITKLRKIRKRIFVC